MGAECRCAGIGRCPEHGDRYDFGPRVAVMAREDAERRQKELTDRYQQDLAALEGNDFAEYVVRVVIPRGDLVIVRVGLGSGAVEHGYLSGQALEAIERSGDEKVRADFLQSIVDMLVHNASAGRR